MSGLNPLEKQTRYGAATKDIEKTRFSNIHAIFSLSPYFLRGKQKKLSDKTLGKHSIRNASHFCAWKLFRNFQCFPMHQENIIFLCKASEKQSFSVHGKNKIFSNEIPKGFLMHGKGCAFPMSIKLFEKYGARVFKKSYSILSQTCCN